jgi:diaminohydroxyphosphoribosylaminopyrimidine deaminase/5-amino-6-(5-phosphoribosylamino)uracil reductase
MPAEYLSLHNATAFLNIFTTMDNRQLSIDNVFMWRCIALAKLGGDNVAPNPLVGAVLVHDEKIIGEGYHQKYGETHAEVNCINSVAEENKKLISSSTLYVSLEPCAHFGKTPPCADLIIKNKIPKVVIGCKDVFTKVDGKGIEKLKNVGIAVTTGILEDECKMLNKRFFTFHMHHRPYIILKWAQTADGKIAANNNERLIISNEFTNRSVHKWRSEEAAILIGTNTALLDDPSLTTRLWQGKNAIRLVLDMNLRLPKSLKLFDEEAPTIIFNKIKNDENKNVLFVKIDEQKNIIQQILEVCYQKNIQSILVEGGAKLLQSFIDQNLWDEGRRIENGQWSMVNGVGAPQLSNFTQTNSENIFDDRIDYFFNENFSL